MFRISSEQSFLGFFTTGEQGYLAFCYCFLSWLHGFLSLLVSRVTWISVACGKQFRGFQLLLMSRVTWIFVAIGGQSYLVFLPLVSMVTWISVAGDEQSH